VFLFLSVLILGGVFAVHAENATRASRYQFVNRETQKALTVSGHILTQETYQGQPDQLWRLQSTTGYRIAIVNHGGGGILSIKDCSGDLPGLVCLQAATDHNLAEQSWHLESGRDVRYWRIVNDLTKMVLAVLERGTGLRPIIVQEKYSGQLRQEWSIESYGYACYDRTAHRFVTRCRLLTRAVLLGQPSMTGLRSTMGVPSIASRPSTSSQRLRVTLRTFARCKPIGLGRSGERVANTPESGFLASPRGCTFRTERRDSWSQVKIQMSWPG
jgi:Ricin-type beta-trefoil lectin domain-like